MNPTEQKPESGAHAAAVVEPKPSWRLSLVWLVPIVAALVGLGLAAKAIMDRGPEITLQFSTADGLEAGKTKIKYKDVEIGTVKSIVLSEDRKTVSVVTDLVREAAPLLVEDTRFWVVRPRVGLAGVSGLGTLLSGSYIGLDVGKSTTTRRHYVGLEEPPLITADRAGREFVLRAEDLGSLDVGSPVYLRRLQVGRVVTRALDKDGSGVTLTIFVDSPYDKFVNPATRFFHTSGVALSLDDRGFKLDVQSMAALVAGGIAFATHKRNADLDPAQEKAAFILHPDDRTAMRLPDGMAQTYTMIFNETIRGLRLGSSVDFRGLPIGEVTSIGVDYAADGKSVVMVVEANIYPSRLARQAVSGSRMPDTRERRHPVMNRMVDAGLRAQLRSGSLVTGEQFIALDFFPKAKPARVDWDRSVPLFPTIPGKLTSLEDDLTEALATLKATLGSANRLVQHLDREVAPDVTAAMDDFRRTLSNADKLIATADKLLASDAPVQQELRETLREVARAARSLRQLTDMLEHQPESLITGKKGDEQ